MNRRVPIPLARLLCLGLALCLADVAAAQETGAIRGRVVASGTLQPLAGAQISIVGTGRGILSNASGDFLVVNVPVGTHTVRVQMLGFTTEEQQVNVSQGQPATVEFALATSAIALDEVVVTGVGVVQQKKSLGQSVASVNAEDYANAPVANVTDVLSGRVAGLVANPGGETGQAAPIRLRGTVSLSQRNGPLVYIDGVRVDNTMSRFTSIATSRLNDLNPNNIERIEVLKGAAAATLYGTEASAGVIQIFTKRGIEGRPRFEFNTTQQVLQLPDRIPDNVVYDASSGQIMRNNPADDFIDLGRHQAYHVSARGGSESARYYSSVWFTDESSPLPNSSLDNKGVNVGIDYLHSDRVQTRLNLEIIQNQIRAPYPPWGLMGEFTLADPRRVDDRRPYGELFYTIAGALAYNNTETTNRYTTSGQLSYQILPGLRAQATVGYNLTALQNVVFIEYGQGLRDSRGRRELQDVQRESTTLDVSAAWEAGLGSALISTLTVGGQSFWESSQVNSTGVQFYPSPGLQTLRGGSNVYLVDEYFEEVINAGVFAQEQLGINDRLFLTAGLRIDGNSAFGDDFGLQAYPKAGLSWTVSEEPFWPLRGVDVLRLRTAYGTSGLQPGAYDALRTWRATALVDNLPAVLPQSVGNSELRPERSTEIELGADVGLFDNRLGLELTYFDQKTADAILNRQLAPSGGFLAPQFINIGELQSRGFELSLDWLALDRTNLRWRLTATGSSIDQKVTDLGDVPGFKTSTNSQRWNWILEGYQPGAWVGPVADPNNRYRLVVPVEQFTNLNQLVPHTLKAASGADSLVFVGNQLPTWTGSLASHLDLPRFNLQLRGMLRTEGGFVMLDHTNLIRLESLITEEAATWIRDLSDPSTPASRRQEIAEAYARVHPAIHSNWVQDGKNVRLQEAALIWTVPRSLQNRLALGAFDDLAITLAGRNLFLWTPYGGIADPGTSSTPQDDFNLNIDYFASPIPRRFELSVRAGF